MERITRKGIAFNPEQLKLFDEVAKKKGYKNRSEAIRSLIRKELIEEDKTDPEKTMLATLTIVYDHHGHDVQHKLTHMQHHSPDLVVSSMHMHIDEYNCLEVLVLKGRVRSIRKLADSIIATKGVKHGKLVLTSTG